MGREMGRHEEDGHNVRHSLQYPVQRVECQTYRQIWRENTRLRRVLERKERCSHQQSPNKRERERESKEMVCFRESEREMTDHNPES